MANWVRPSLPLSWTAGATPALVGRGRELSLLDDAWSAVTDGMRQVVFIGGAPGAGKSRLLTEIATTLYRHDAAVLVGTCVAELGLPYQPFAEPISAVQTATEDERTSQRLAALAGWPDVTWSTAEQPAHYRQLYDAAVCAFRAAASQRPLVLALEDLHWADEPALQLLTYLVEQTAECRMLLVATHRTTAPERAGPLTRTMTQLDRLDGVHRLDLGPLDIEDVATYLVQETDVPAHKAHEAAVILRTQSGGNPFFLRELWRDLSARGGLAAIDAGTVVAPESVRDAFQIRLDRLTQDHRQAIETAAVLGDSFETAVLLAAAGYGSDDALAALDEATMLGVIEQVPGAADSFRFPHALARQAVLDLTSPSSRIRAHRRIADAIERQFPTLDRRVQRLAHHCATAHALGLAAKAVQYLTEAGTLADQILAHVEAAALFDRASSLTEHPEERDELRLRAARSYFLGANFLRAQEIDELVCTTGVPGKRMQAAIGFENACFRDGSPSQRAVELLTVVLRDKTGEHSEQNRIRALAGLGRALSHTGISAEAAQASDKAVELARASGDDELLAATLETSVTSLREATREPHIGLARAAELCELATRTQNMYALGPAALYRGLDAYLLGEPNELRAAEIDMRLAASETGQFFFEYLAGCSRYCLHFVAGEFIAAERTCSKLRELAASVAVQDTEGSNGLQMFMIRRATGGLEPVRPLITGGESPAEHWPPGLLALYSELGLRQPAARLLAWLLDTEQRLYRTTAQWPAVVTFMVEAALFLEDKTAANRLRPLMADFAGLNLMSSEFNAVFGSADRYLGAIDSLLGTGKPEELFAAAVEMDVKTGSPVHEAETLAALVVHRRRHGGQSRDDGVVERARSLVERLGLARVGRMLELPRASRRPDGLTAREVEVLALLGEGLSNRDIAKRLVIAENTAANHVRSVLMKTGSANRTRAAIYAATHGLLA